MIMVITFRDDFRHQVLPYLQEHGFEVCIPPHRQDVLPMVAEQQPLAVLLDLYVTNPSGLEVLGELRAHGYKGKVIVLAGSSISSKIPQAYPLGVDQVIGGPQGFDGPLILQLSQILSAIRTALHPSIAKHAFELYEKRGRIHGHDLEDWLKAEREILKIKKLRTTKASRKSSRKP